MICGKCNCQVQDGLHVCYNCRSVFKYQGETDEQAQAFAAQEYARYQSQFQQFNQQQPQPQLQQQPQQPQLSQQQSQQQLQLQPQPQLQQQPQPQQQVQYQQYIDLQNQVIALQQQVSEQQQAINRLELESTEILNGRASDYADKHKEQKSDSYSAPAIVAFAFGLLAIATSFIPIVNFWSIFIGAIGFILAIVGVVQTSRGKRRGAVLNAIGLILCIASIGIALATNTALSSYIDQLRTGIKPVAATSTVSSNSSASPQNKADYSNMPIGQSVALQDGLTVAVVDAQEVTQSYSSKPLMRVTVSYVNNGSDSVSYNALDWKSENANGVERMMEIFAGSDGNSLDSGKLKPGGTITGNVYFENDATKVYYYSNGLFQDESAICWNLR